MFGTASSCDAGDRAQFGCPPDEVCDPATEDGLHFVGAEVGEDLFGTDDVKTLAVGGRQDVELFEVDADGHHVAFELPFTPTLDARGLEIEATRGNVITLRGTARGDGFLRILSPDSGDLFDRVFVATNRIEAVRLNPSVMVLLQDGRDSTLYAPGATGFLSLRGEGAGIVVDQGARISGTKITQRAWDRFEIGALAPGFHTLQVTAGDRGPETIELEIAHATSLDHLFDVEVSRAHPAIVCFTALSGDRPIQVAWQFEVEGGTLQPSRLQGCTNVHAGSGDAVTVRASADGLSTELVLPVVASAAKRAPAFIERVRFQTTAGDRAAAR